ncbi:hypothetical protein [Halalkalicoccus ordinarius]|uniref:hypothetical protein n=1 Tax=Halalkalicoccus ordinarius TaxID=3116651 RepID=UPI00300EFC41
MLGFLRFLGNTFTRLEVLQVFHLFWLFALWPVVSLLIGAVKQSIGYEGDDPGPRDGLQTVFSSFFPSSIDR